MKKILLAGLIIIQLSLFSQEIGIIDDKDGYLNLRKSPNSRAEVLHKILENEVFFYYELAPWNHDKSTTSKWLKAMVPKNNYSLSKDMNDWIEGYVYLNKVKNISKLEDASKEVSITYNLIPFDSTDKIIVKSKEGNWIKTIDGFFVYGTDGMTPTDEVKNIDVVIKGDSITIPEIYHSDLFECGDESHITKNGELYFINQWQSYGAGSYMVVWVFENKKLKQRLVGSFV